LGGDFCGPRSRVYVPTSAQGPVRVRLQMPHKSVRDWNRRKEERSRDPLFEHDSSFDVSAPLTRCIGKMVEARAGGTVIARSPCAKVNVVNRRHYFPREACYLRHFEASPKRWR